MLLPFFLVNTGLYVIYILKCVFYVFDLKRLSRPNCINGRDKEERVRGDGSGHLVAAV